MVAVNESLGHEIVKIVANCFCEYGCNDGSEKEEAYSDALAYTGSYKLLLYPRKC